MPDEPDLMRQVRDGEIWSGEQIADTLNSQMAEGTDITELDDDDTVEIKIDFVETSESYSVAIPAFALGGNASKAKQLVEILNEEVPPLIDKRRIQKSANIGSVIISPDLDVGLNLKDSYLKPSIRGEHN